MESLFQDIIDLDWILTNQVQLDKTFQLESQEDEGKKAIKPVDKEYIHQINSKLDKPLFVSKSFDKKSKEILKAASYSQFGYVVFRVYFPFGPGVPTSKTFRAHEAMTIQEVVSRITQRIIEEETEEHNYYLFLTSEELILDEDKMLKDYKFLPFRNQNKNYLEFRKSIRNVPIIVKTVHEGVYSTKKVFIRETVPVAQIIEELKAVLNRETDIFTEYTKPLFILDSKCYIPSQGLSPNIPFILIQSKNAESVVRTNPLITSSEDLSSFIKDKQALPLGNHDFEKRYFNQPAWCMACKNFIWGIMKKQGLKCKRCKFICHHKCLDKVPAECNAIDFQSLKYNDYKLRRGTNGFFASFIGEKEEEAPIFMAIPIPIMEGYLLTKKSTTLNQTRKLRYYRLQQDKLFYFKSHEDVNPLGYYDIQQVLSLDSPHLSITGSKNNFRLRLKGLNLDLTPSDELETTTKLWIYNLEQWILLREFYMKQTNLNKIGFFSLIPTRLILYIFSFLSKLDLSNIARVCKRWYYFKLDLVQNTLSSNWTTGTYQLQTFKEHNGKSIVGIQVHKNTMISADSQCLRKWIRGLNSQTITGHRDITCVSLGGQKIASGSQDKTVRIWNLNSGSLLQVLAGHTETVTCINLDSVQLVSGSEDTNICHFDLETGKLLGKLQGHINTVSCLQLENHVVMSGSYDKSIFQWDLRAKPYKFVNSLRKVHETRVTSLQFDYYHLASSGDNRIHVFDLRTFEKTGSMEHDSIVNTFMFHQDRLASGCTDKIIRIWENWTGVSPKCFLKLSNHTAPVTSIFLNRSSLISAGEDGLIQFHRFY